MISRQISWLTSTIPRQPRHQWCWRYRQLKAPVWPPAQWRPVAQDLEIKAVRNIEKSSKLLCNYGFTTNFTSSLSRFHIRNAVLILSLHSGVRGNSLAQARAKIHGHELVTSGYTGCPRIDPISWLHMLHQVLNFTSFASWVPFCWWFALKGILWPSYNSSRHGKMSVVPEISHASCEDKSSVQIPRCGQGIRNSQLTWRSADRKRTTKNWEISCGPEREVCQV